MELQLGFGSHTIYLLIYIQCKTVEFTNKVKSAIPGLSLRITRLRSARAQQQQQQQLSFYLSARRQLTLFFCPTQLIYVLWHNRPVLCIDTDRRIPCCRGDNSPLHLKL